MSSAQYFIITSPADYHFTAFMRLSARPYFTYSAIPPLALIYKCFITSVLDYEMFQIRDFGSVDFILSFCGAQGILIKD